MTTPTLDRAAIGLVGAPFRWRGRDPVTGVDCVGLVACALSRMGLRPDTPLGYSLRTLDIAPFLGFAARNGLEVASHPPAAGDVVLFKIGSVQAHLAISTGRARYVHAHAGLGRVVHGPIDRHWEPMRRWWLRQFQE